MIAVEVYPSSSPCRVAVARAGVVAGDLYDLGDGRDHGVAVRVAAGARRGRRAHGDVGEAERLAECFKAPGVVAEADLDDGRAAGRRDDVGQAGAVRADDDGRPRELRQLAPRRREPRRVEDARREARPAQRRHQLVVVGDGPRARPPEDEDVVAESARACSYYSSQQLQQLYIYNVGC